jgi:hypothetical protein
MINGRDSKTKDFLKIRETKKRRRKIIIADIRINKRAQLQIL